MNKKCYKIVILACICVILGSTMSVIAGTNDYLSYESVIKSSSATVESNSTGTNTFYVFYGARCNNGIMTAQVQYYSDGWYNVPGATQFLSEGDSGEWSAYYAPFKLYRLKLGASGIGTGWIQGQE